jgi:hypothetical protein
MSNVVYLISSLPALTFGQSPPISLDTFHSEAEEQLSAKEYKTLRELDLKNNTEAATGKLKNFAELVEEQKADLLEIRNAKENERSPEIITVSKSLLKQNPLEREKSIMQWQWEALTDIDAVESFTITEVLVYKLKLQILHRLNSFSEEKGMEILKSVVEPPKKTEEEQKHGRSKN